MSLDRLIENIIKKQNPTVAGLRPKAWHIFRSYIKELLALQSTVITLEGSGCRFVGVQQRFD